MYNILWNGNLLKKLVLVENINTLKLSNFSDSLTFAPLHWRAGHMSSCIFWKGRNCANFLKFWRADFCLSWLNNSSLFLRIKYLSCISKDVLNFQFLFPNFPTSMCLQFFAFFYSLYWFIESNNVLSLTGPHNGCYQSYLTSYSACFGFCKTVIFISMFSKVDWTLQSIIMFSVQSRMNSQGGFWAHQLINRVSLEKKGGHHLKWT
jgi:hypothetical protein